MCLPRLSRFVLIVFRIRPQYESPVLAAALLKRRLAKSNSTRLEKISFALPTLFAYAVVKVIWNSNCAVPECQVLNEASHCSFFDPLLGLPTSSLSAVGILLKTSRDATMVSPVWEYRSSVTSFFSRLNQGKQIKTPKPQKICLQIFC